MVAAPDDMHLDLMKVFQQIETAFERNNGVIPPMNYENRVMNSTQCRRWNNQFIEVTLPRCGK